MSETRKLAAILVSDVVGYSRLAGADEDRIWRDLDCRDLDIGGTAAIPLDVAGPNGARKLIFAIGKTSEAYLLDRVRIDTRPSESSRHAIEDAFMRRREFLLGAAASVASSPLAVLAAEGPPLSSKAAFVAWMTANRPAEDSKYVERRWDRYQVLLSFNDLWTPADKRAFLMTPRQEFCLPENREDAYVGHYLDIGFGVTITPPGTMGRMTSALDIRGGDKVLEIGTGSGYQSALLTYLTPRVYSIEIIPGLAGRTRGAYDRLIRAGYREYGAIATRSGDGYYGWPDAAPFDKIIVTCGIDHIPPPLLQQLKPSGIMVIPVGPPGAQHILKVVKKVGPDGTPSVARSDIFGGKVIPFVPLSGGHQSEG